MVNLSVCAIMPVNGRPEMVARAVRSFREQTYQDKLLFIWDSGVERALELDEAENEIYAWCPGDNGVTVGVLRNSANAEAIALNRWSGRLEYPEIFCHLDSDDWSHPRRIEEQVALLQASGKECVGYRDMLFWTGDVECWMCNGNWDPTQWDGSPQCSACNGIGRVTGKNNGAWLYTNGNTKYCLGTSLCYWRRVWERRPFEDLPKGPTGEGEDSRWLREVDSLGVACVAAQDEGDGDLMDQPRMIASAHGSNTSSMVALAIRRQASEVKRVPQLDSYCRERMAL